MADNKEFFDALKQQPTEVNNNINLNPSDDDFEDMPEDTGASYEDPNEETPEHLEEGSPLNKLVDADETADIAIIMTRMDSSKKDVVSEKVGHLFEKMKPDHLCVGVAFGDRDNPKGDLFLGAMSSLNHARINGQDTFVMF